MLLIGRLKLVRCSLLVVIWLVAKPKLLLPKKKLVNRGDEVGPLNRATCTDVVTRSRTTLPSATDVCNHQEPADLLQDRFERRW